MLPTVLAAASTLRPQNASSGGCGSLGCFAAILAVGAVLFLVLRGRRDRPEQLGAAKRAMGSGPVLDHVFESPYPKCPTCSAAGDKMKQQWDGFRKVTWTCGYCGTVAGVQELRDEELPPAARRRLGLDPPRAEAVSGGDFPRSGGAGDLLTGVMIGTMLGGGRPHSWGDGEPRGDGEDSPQDADASGEDSGDWGDGDSGGSDDGEW